MQQHILKDQDVIISDINDTANRLQNIAVDIKVQINEQGNKINKLDVEIGKTEKKLSFIQTKLSHLLKTNEQSQICTILILFGTLFALIFLLFFT
ncbi:unnamed protein product [Paramecium octaurelia]|uniref:t-SNARE coiled-coil homology domain-containing protein n=1 Tax=Paramecium octaurelia TaxID=43137 RepID=A0A8S1WVN4_PAROT|nr:unnamed protein product [Paramecium octaurelia]